VIIGNGGLAKAVDKGSQKTSGVSSESSVEPSDHLVCGALREETVTRS
jgi:hypothetical protein